MSNIYSKDLISKEIANLFNNVEEFCVSKDSMTEAIRYMYLHSSSNN